MRLRRAALVMIGMSCACLTGIPAQAQLLGPSRYLCFDSSATTATGNCLDRDSPFNDVPFGWFYLKDYEDLQTAAPGVTMTAECGNVTGLGCPYLSTLKWVDRYTDSVDEDDGDFDGFGQTVQLAQGERGQTIQAVGATGILFTFDPAVLGNLPTHAGIVWTDGGGLVQFEAWDAGGVPLGTLQADIEDGGIEGSTAEDHFFGVVHAGGISAIRIATGSGNIEVDHLQYGNPVCVLDASCDDGDACTVDVCAAGACQSTPVTGDGDGDGSACPDDCDDADPAVYPGAAEINDGIDNHCPGDVGYGLVDELAQDAEFDAQRSRFCWTPQEGANGYEVARSSRTRAGEILCQVEFQKQTCFMDRDNPEPGVVSYFLARALQPVRGSWGDGEHRAEGCVFEDCSDGVDNDLDGFTDCDDNDDCHDPAICPGDTYSFVDTPARDATSESFVSFFGHQALQGTEYLLFSVTGSYQGPQEVCVARADFYRDAYLALWTSARGIATSGNWEKWYRSNGGPWIGPVTNSLTNYFGQIWLTLGSWSIDTQMGGLWMSPGSTQQPEVGGNYVSCEYASIHCTLTIRVAPTRLEACGF